eukprot:7855669-Pyramimonas_sp.AAC.1
MPFDMWLTRTRMVTRTRLRDHPCAHCGTYYATAHGKCKHARGCKVPRAFFALSLNTGPWHRTRPEAHGLPPKYHPFICHEPIPESSEGDVLSWNNVYAFVMITWLYLVEFEMAAAASSASSAPAAPADLPAKCLEGASNRAAKIRGGGSSDAVMSEKKEGTEREVRQRTGNTTPIADEELF